MKRALAVAIVLLVTSVSAFALPGNLITNGDFATNDLTGWTKISDVGSTSVDWDASYGYAKLSCTSGTLGIYQGFTTTIGQEYEINANWHGNGAYVYSAIMVFGGSTPARTFQTPSDSAIVSIVDQYNNPSIYEFPVGGGWDTLANYYYVSGPGTNRFTATSTTMYVAIKAMSQETMDLYVDDVTVTSVVPEPSSLVALFAGIAGIGGMAFRRRK